MDLKRKRCTLNTITSEVSYDKINYLLFFFMSLRNFQKYAPVTLPMGFADQVLDLEMRLEEEESLELIQILSQMYRVNMR